MTPTIGISGLQEAQRENLRDVQAVSPSGGLARAVQMVALDANRSQTTQIHVDTGALRASARVSEDGAARWSIYIDPGARNSRSGVLVSSYAEIENDRGGSHGYADITFNQADVFVGRAVGFLL